MDAITKHMLDTGDKNTCDLVEIFHLTTVKGISYTGNCVEDSTKCTKHKRIASIFFSFDFNCNTEKNMRFYLLSFQ